ncbi:ATP-grasp domain-containing protein [Pseudomonas sp. NY15181]|uniref:ATP-grasp domain-containing protein n=1 Tax=Pseudomonas sp. NY15181 TaxID=3400349 RepID=UPI003A8921A3
MLLPEHLGKELLRECDITVPFGTTIRSRDELERALGSLKGASVLKAQIASGGRGKGGGIRFAYDRATAYSEFDSLLGAEVNGLRVDAVLVEDFFQVTAERYIGFIIESSEIWLILGSKGGVDIEDISQSEPETVIRLLINPIVGPSWDEMSKACEKIGLNNRQAYFELARNLFKVLKKNDATMVEINPLAEIGDGSLVALDARILIDESAIFRQPRLIQHQCHDTHSEADQGLPRPLAKIKQLSNGGAVAYAGIGGGIGITVADWIADRGQTVSLMIDLDDLIASGRLEEAAPSLFQSFDEAPTVKVIFISLMTCSYYIPDLAEALLSAATARSQANAKPVVFNLHGRGEAQSESTFLKYRVRNSQNIADAIEKVIAAANGEVLP